MCGYIWHYGYLIVGTFRYMWVCEYIWAQVNTFGFMQGHNCGYIY